MKAEDKIQHKGSGGGGGKSSGGSQDAPVEAPDTLRSIQYAKILDLVSEGEIGGLVDGLKSIYLNDTPIQNADGTFNFKNVKMDERVGTQAQNYMPGFNDAEAETVVGTEVTHAISVTRTISNVNDTAVRLTLGFPQMTAQDTSTGNLNGTSVVIAIDVQNNGGGFIAQALRKLFQASAFSLTTAGGTTTVTSTQFHVTVDWTGQLIQAPQTCTFQLQYRPTSGGAWTTNQTFTFKGGTTANIGGGNTITGGTIVYPSGSKTFSLTLVDNTYEFRVVKTTGSLQTLTGIQTGSTKGGTVAITAGEAYVPVYNDTISGKCISRYQRAYRIELDAPGPWDIRVRRITADNASSILQNKTFWDSLTEIVDVKLTYPNSAYVGIRIDAKQFNNIPTRGFECHLLLVQIPTNYDPLTREYTGSWDGTFQVAWSDNPAWCFYDLVTNARYGLGEFITATQVDKWSLYTIAQYCDQMVPDGFGGIEPRFTCNIYLQSREESFKVIANMASIFRGIAWWQAGAITASQDAPASVVQLFNQANVIDGNFNYSGSSGRVRHNVVLVAWNNPQDAYRQKIEYVEDAAAIALYGIIQSEVVAAGCTSRGQAHRVGKWIIYSEQNETETVSFRAGMDAVFCGPGDLIQTADPIRSGERFGGRLLATTTAQVQLDAAFTLNAGIVYEISCILPDGTIETVTVTTSAGTTDTIDVSPSFSQAPQVYAMWVISSTELVPQSWRIVSIAEVNKGQVDITALAYRAEKYDAVENNLVLQPLPVSLIEAGQPGAPANLQFSEALYLSGVGVVAVKGTLSWQTVGGAISYVVTYQRTDQNPVSISGILNNSIDIEPMQEGNYSITVNATNALGRKSQDATLAVTVYGKTLPPSDVTNFKMVALSAMAQINWDASPDLDVNIGGYMRIRFTPDLVAPLWTSAIDMGPQIPGNATNTTLPLLTGSYLAKWIDSSGNPSTNAIAISSDAASIVTLNAFITINENPAFGGNMTAVLYDADLGGIKLDGTGSFDALTGNVDDLVGQFDSLGSGGIQPSGTYDFFNSVDLGSVQTSRLSASILAAGYDANDLISLRGLISTWSMVGSSVVDNVAAELQVRTTNDNPVGSPVSWSAWQPFFVGDWTARAFEFRLLLSTQDSNHNILVTTLQIIVDMPDRDEFGNDLTSGAGAYIVTYATPFVSAPALGITAQNMATGDYYAISAKSATGFTITFKNAAGANISRLFDYHAKGY